MCADQLDLALQLGEPLVIAGGARHLLVQGAEPLVETGNLLFQAGEVLSSLSAGRATPWGSVSRGLGAPAFPGPIAAGLQVLIDTAWEQNT